MTYLPTMGDIDLLKFNCTKYPGICKPMDFPTLGIVRDMQNQINRVASAKGMRLIATDGDIGPGTVAAVAAINHFLAPLSFDTSSNTAVVLKMVGIAIRAKAVADGLGVPAMVSAPIPAKAPAIITPTGIEIKAPPMVGASALDAVKNLGMPTLLLLGAAAIGAGYFLTRPTKSSSAPAKPRTRYRTRTRTRYIRRYRPRSRR
jgi:hypothetical protein